MDQNIKFNEGVWQNEINVKDFVTEYLFADIKIFYVAFNATLKIERLSLLCSFVVNRHIHTLS